MGMSERLARATETNVAFEAANSHRPTSRMSRSVEKLAAEASVT
jgi:hypothetical protein